MIESGDSVPLAEFDMASCREHAMTPCWLTAPAGLLEPIRLPALVVRGARPGPTAVFVAGVHGDEFEGIAALPELAAGLDPKELAGSVLALPVCNPFAYAAQSRSSPSAIDGRNLAREFPGDPVGSSTQRLAAALFGLAGRLLGAEDLFVDLHSAGTRYRYLRLVGFRDIEGPARERSECAARHFGEGNLWRLWDQAGMFNAETARAGIPTVALEAPGQGGCAAHDVEWYVAGLYNLLRYQGMISGLPPPRDERPARCPTEILAETDGLFRTRVRVGDRVRAGDELGRVHTPLGEVKAVLSAPHDGHIWALRSFGTVRADDYVAWVTE
jgi:predicted deacylase